MKISTAVLVLALTSMSASAFVSPQPPGQHYRTTSELAMGGNSFDRFARVFRSNVNKWVSKMEDPEKVILQSVTDMQNDLVRIRQSYAESMGTQRRLQRQKAEAEQTAAEWHQRAQLAVTRGKDSLAKEALSRRQILLDQAAGLQQQMDSLALDQLYQAMTNLEAKIREANMKKEQLVARAKTAKNTAAVNDMLSGMTGKTSMDAFSRMEEKVEALEAAAEASAEMSLLGGGTEKVSLEAEFLLLEQTSTVEQELEAMKQEMKLLNGESSRPTKTIDQMEREVARSSEAIKIPVR